MCQLFSPDLGLGIQLLWDTEEYCGSGPDRLQSKNTLSRICGAVDGVRSLFTIFERSTRHYPERVAAGESQPALAEIDIVRPVTSISPYRRVRPEMSQVSRERYVINEVTLRQTKE